MNFKDSHTGVQQFYNTSSVQSLVHFPSWLFCKFSSQTSNTFSHISTLRQRPCFLSHRENKSIEKVTSSNSHYHIYPATIICTHVFASLSVTIDGLLKFLRSLPSPSTFALDIRNSYLPGHIASVIFSFDLLHHFLFFPSFIQTCCLFLPLKIIKTFFSPIFLIPFSNSWQNSQKNCLYFSNFSSPIFS